MKSYRSNESWNSSAASSSKSSTMKTSSGLSVSVCRFQNQLKVLPKDKQDDVTYILGCYHNSRNIYYLVESLKNTLNENEREALFPALRQVLPKSDRPGFDQFTCETTYGRKSPAFRNGSSYQQRTDDSGIGSNSAAQSVGEMSRQGSSKRSFKSMKPSRSSSMSDLSRKSESRQTPKRFSSGTFGSAVRRKIQAALTRKSSSASREIKGTFRRRHNSEGQLSDVETNNISNNVSKSGPLDSKSACACVKFTRQKHGNDLGFTIGGGSEIDSDVYVSEVRHGSPADKMGLNRGDVIVQINDVPVHKGISHETVAMMLKSSDRLSIYFQPPGARNAMPQEKGFSWLDTSGRPVSPPHDQNSDSNHRQPVIDSRKSNVHLLTSGERKVTLTVDPNQSLGLMIRGGAEYGLGIYVTGVDEHSVAENAGLKAGDEILDVNNVCLSGATHAEAVNLIRSSQMLIITVRHVGRIPQACLVQPKQRLVDDRVSLHSNAAQKKMLNSSVGGPPNGIKSAFQRRVMSPKQLILPNMHVKSLPSKGVANISNTMSTLEDALLASSLWMTLTDQERRSVRYYVKEYAAGHVTPDALVLSLSELFNSHEKFSLMSTVRECINERDLDRFDVLVLRREIEVLKSRHQDEEPPPTDSSTPDKPSESHRSGTTAEHSDQSISMEPAGHSTPNDSFAPTERAVGTPATRRRAQKLSPVRPASNPPPPPVKTPPAKPRRSTLKRRVDAAKASSTESAQADSETGTEREEERSHSPFSLALEKHKVTVPSHSGRIKIGAKAAPSHHAIPSKDFFAGGGSVEPHPPLKDLMRPVKNTSLRVRGAVKKPAPAPRPHEELSSDNSSSMNDSDFPPPPSSFRSTSPSSFVEASSFASKSPRPSNSISLRSSSFGSSANSRISSNNILARQYPVKADVHQPPSRENGNGDHGEARMTSFSCQQKHPFDNDASSSDEESSFPYFRKDVELQKVVIFRTTRTLGLTLEGGAGTKQPLPRVLKIQPGSCAYLCARLRVGHVVHSVNGSSLKGCSHDDAIRAIASAFKERGRDSIELGVSGPYD